MNEMLEIRWHGRGGQGAKTAAILMGEAAAASGKYVQAFPEYGPERMGAPVTAYNRISDEPITVHSGVTNPKYVVVLDATFIGTVDITEGMDDDGTIIINTPEPAAQIRQKLDLTGKEKVSVSTVDATRIAMECIGLLKPNTPMLGALARTSGALALDDLLADTRRKLEKKFRDKPEVIDGNIKAIERAYQEVSGEDE